MDEQTIQKLNQLNQDFYLKIAAEFSETRQQPWAGWQRIVPLLESHFTLNKEITVLDVGCGNGRFGAFLETETDLSIEYFGTDSNRKLLDDAEESLSQVLPPDKLHLLQADLLKNPPATQADLIGLFGVLHHIPGYAQRAKLLVQLAKQLNPGGLLIFTTWQFDQIPNMLSRQKSFAEIGLDSQDVERNDYLLTWDRGTQAVRYCHLIDKDELSRLVADTNLTVSEQFLADGKQQQTNQYVILEKTL